MISIGIPRALFYFRYYPMFKAFFEAMGVEVIVSPPTTQTVLSSGSSRVVADTCLPVKVFCGHAISLEGKCDYVFIPVIRSVERKVYNCAKFLGLPDMVRAVIPESPPVLEIEIDITRGKRNLYQAIYQLGRHFTWNPLKIKRACMVARQADLDYCGLMSDHGLNRKQALEKIAGISEEGAGQVATGYPTQTQATIAVIGHHYLLCDEHVNHRLIHRLQQAGNRVLTPEMLIKEELESAMTKLTGMVYWAYEEEVLGAGMHYLENGVDGIISVMAFGCGPDSLIMDMMHRQARGRKNVAFMSLTLEEHTAETGMITRLEAFLDMVYRRKRKQVEMCV
ncbi:acyl-CoA dehydratase activase-related protein [Chloroflexota bacterium]